MHLSLYAHPTNVHLATAGGARWVVFTGENGRASTVEICLHNMPKDVADALVAAVVGQTRELSYPTPTNDPQYPA